MRARTAVPARTRRRTGLALLLLALAAPSVTGCSAAWEASGGAGPGAAGAAGATAAPVRSQLGQGQDYVVVVGTAKREHRVAAGSAAYCPLDGLGRAVCAYAELTPQMRDRAQSRGRQDIEVDPAGWPVHNGSVEIPALKEVKGSKSYRGWMFNRSHLLADSLGGAPEKQNLVTGTRTQNVGSHQEDGQYAGGMARTELIARNYLDSAAARSCPLYYAAAPNYEGDELIPRTVTVDVQSCDKSIDERVEVSNTANGWAIDYADGTYSPAS